MSQQINARPLTADGFEVIHKARSEEITLELDATLCPRPKLGSIITGPQGSWIVKKCKRAWGNVSRTPAAKPRMGWIYQVTGRRYTR